MRRQILTTSASKDKLYIFMPHSSMTKAVQLSRSLLQANNCFYVILNDKGDLVQSNEYFKQELADSAIKVDSFLNHFSKQEQQKFSETFNDVVADSISPLSVETVKGNKVVKWNVFPQTNDVDQLTGFELIGAYIASSHATNDESSAAKNKWLQEERQLKSIIARLRKIMNSSLDVICSIDESGRFRKVSAAAKTIWGYDPHELVGTYFIKYVYQDDLHASRDSAIDVIHGAEIRNLENRFIKKDGSLVPLVWSSRWDEADKRFYSIARDATEKLASESALKASEEKYKVLFYDNPFPMWIYDVDTFAFIEVNDSAIKHYGYTREEFLQMTIKDIRPVEEVDNLINFRRDEHPSANKGYWTHQKKNDEIIYVEITAHSLNLDGRQAKLVLANDRTDEVVARNELITINERYSFLSKATIDAFWDSDIRTNTIQWNDGIKTMFNYTDTEEVNKRDWWESNLHPDDRERVLTKLDHHIYQHIPHWQDEYRFKCADGSYKYILDRGFTVYDENDEPVRMIGAMQDLTERKLNELVLEQLNDSLQKRASELAESNAELERFAYVASHDLQEPLRMVTSFLQLLEKRYKEQLDKKAHEYIDFAVDGADRMKKLILDLLEYSRVNTSPNDKEEVNLNLVIKDLKHTYGNTLLEINGTITADNLPTVQGSKTQIMQVFQNLIGNAIKYKSTEPPHIKISCKNDGVFYQFSVADNGIGIDPRFFHKIFIIFQRLHNREKYSGTGIGLAICKKIVEKHRGKIWVESEHGKGSTFYFTLPKTDIS